MARKTAQVIDAEFVAFAEMRLEMALDVYGAQDEKTQAIIDKMVTSLEEKATGFTTRGALVDEESLGGNLLYLAVEVVKDLAYMGIRVGTFKFPDHVCASCGQELV